MIDTCTDCQKTRIIMLKFQAAAQVEIDGVSRRVLVDVKLCRGCLKKRVAAKKTPQN